MRYSTKGTYLIIGLFEVIGAERLWLPKYLFILGQNEYTHNQLE